MTAVMIILVCACITLGLIVQHSNGIIHELRRTAIIRGHADYTADNKFKWKKIENERSK